MILNIKLPSVIVNDLNTFFSDIVFRNDATKYIYMCSGTTWLARCKKHYVCVFYKKLYTKSFLIHMVILVLIVHLAILWNLEKFLNYFKGKIRNSEKIVYLKNRPEHCSSKCYLNFERCSILGFL